MTNWLVLTATLPTHPSALRVRVWRALKASGAGALREGVYVLPVHAPTAPALWEIEKTISAAGAQAHMLEVQARDAAQEQVFRALFDRADLYGELLLALKEFRAGLKTASETTLRKGLRDLEQQLQAITSSDFFPGKAGERAAQALATLRREVDLRLSPGEPEPASAAIERLSIDDHQGRTWATRKRPWVDRLATAWLVQRFIDRSPTFIWLDEPARCPRKALGYDFDGARFTHVGQRVTFEVVAASFGLDDDPALQGVGRLVHAIDVGGSVLDEAAGFELIVRGLQQQHANDDALLAAAVGLFDTLYVAMGSRP
jgi:hypothetical protein